MVLHSSSIHSCKNKNSSDIQVILPGATNVVELDEKKKKETLALQDNTVESTCPSIVPPASKQKALEADDCCSTSSDVASVDSVGEKTCFDSVDGVSEKFNESIDDLDTEDTFSEASKDLQDNTVDSTASDDGYCTSEQESGKDEVESKYEVKRIAGKGRGMFATKRIYPGEVVMSEQPLLIVPDKVFIDPEKCERFLDKAVIKMTEHQRKRFFSLSDCRSSDPTYLGIFYTNDMDWEEDVCLCPSMARANHSCSPNTEFCSRKDIGEQRLVAITTIEIGEEITLSYMSAAAEGSEIRKIRQAYLRSLYGFQCICKLCTLQGEEFERDESLREEIKEIQSYGINNLDVVELERLLYLCKDVFPKTSYILELVETIYNKSQTEMDKHMQCVRALSLVINCHGEDSEVAQIWRDRLQLDPIRALEILHV